AEQLADGSARTGTDGSLRYALRARVVARGFAHCCVRAPCRAPRAQVEDDCCGDDRDTRNAGIEPDAGPLEPVHHAIGSGESEGGAALLQYRIDAGHEMGSRERVALARPGGEAANRYGPAERPEQHRAAGARLGIRRVSDAQAVNQLAGHCQNAPPASTAAW